MIDVTQGCGAFARMGRAGGRLYVLQTPQEGGSYRLRQRPFRGSGSRRRHDAGRAHRLAYRGHSLQVAALLEVAGVTMRLDPALEKLGLRLQAFGLHRAKPSRRQALYCARPVSRPRPVSRGLSRARSFERKIPGERECKRLVLTSSARSSSVCSSASDSAPFATALCTWSRQSCTAVAVVQREAMASTSLLAERGRVAWPPALCSWPSTHQASGRAVA